MPRNGSGTYSLPPAVNPIPNGGPIESAPHNTNYTDIATALTGSLTADGQKVWTGDQNAGSKKITTLASGTASSDAVNKGQLDAVAATASASEPKARSISTHTTGGAAGVVDNYNVISGATSLNIPNAAAVNTGKSFRVTATAASTLIFTSNQLKIANTTATLLNIQPGDSFTFVSDGSNWHIGDSNIAGMDAYSANVAGARPFGTTFTNGTQPIQVYMTVTYAAGVAPHCYITVGGITRNMWSVPAAASSQTLTLIAYIPSRANYIATAGTSPSSYTWYEVPV